MKNPYIILSNSGLGGLETMVNNSIKDGYIALGAPFFDRKENVYQAMLHSDDMQILNFNASTEEDSK